MRAIVALLLAPPLLMVGCASTPRPATCAAIGAALGGGGGAAYGADNDRHHDGDSIAGYGALGLVVGAGAGYGICYALQDREPEPQVAQAEPSPPPAPVREPAPAPPPPAAPDPCRERVTFEGVHFDFDRAEIRPQGRSILDGVAARLQECRETRIRIAGHTDAIGSDAYNQGLSERRAAAVQRYLAGRGIAASRLETVGYGESRPVADNATSAGRASNRRVELDPLP